MTLQEVAANITDGIKRRTAIYAQIKEEMKEFGALPLTVKEQGRFNFEYWNMRSATLGQHGLGDETAKDVRDLVLRAMGKSKLAQELS